MKKVAIILAFIPSLALAQQATPNQQPQPRALDRLSASLGNCIGRLEYQADQVADLTRQMATFSDKSDKTINDLKAQLSAAQARVKELEAEVAQKAATTEPSKQ